MHPPTCDVKLNQILNSLSISSIIINGLINACRKDALELGKALAEVNQIIKDTQAEAEASSQALGLRMRELEERDALIARYKSLFGLVMVENE